MLIFPAIDLYEGQAVRLYKGDYQQKTIYSKDPLQTAMDFKEQGARAIHLVDLEGAKNGKPINDELIVSIKEKTGLFCEVGGGIRMMKDIDHYINNGLDRIILGTAALKDQELLRQALAKYGDKIAVGVDLKDGRPAVEGWIESGDVDADTFFDELSSLGVSTIIVTDISKDGTMKGTNTKLYQDLSGRYDLQIIASGGVSSMEDIRQLKDLGIYGAIIGRAYYNGAIDLSAAIKEAL